MSKKIYLVLLAFVVVITTSIYGVPFVDAHSGGGTSAHGDTIDVKIKEVWVGSSSSDLQRVFSGPSDGPVTVTAASNQWMRIDLEATTSTVDSVLDNINPFSENWPDIGECVFWDDFYSQRWGMDPPDSRSPWTSGTVETLLGKDGVADDRLYNNVTCWFGDASLQDSHTVSDEALLIVQPPGGPGQTLGVDLTASPASITAGQSTSLTADVSGTAQGTIHYQFDCTNNGSYEVDVTNNTDPYTTNTCSYSSPGNYTARVHVERGSAPPAEDTVGIAVSSGNVLPTGYHDGTDNSGCRTTGWARDPDTPNTPVRVHIYLDGAAGSGAGIIADVLADQTRSDLPYADKNHGFDVSLPSLKDGKSHTLYAYPIDTTTNLGSPSNPLNRTPLTIQCSGGGGPPPPGPSCQPATDIKVQ